MGKAAHKDLTDQAERAALALEKAATEQREAREQRIRAGQCGRTPIPAGAKADLPDAPPYTIKNTFIDLVEATPPHCVRRCSSLPRMQRAADEAVAGIRAGQCGRTPTPAP